MAQFYRNFVVLNSLKHLSLSVNNILSREISTCRSFAASHRLLMKHEQKPQLLLSGPEEDVVKKENDKNRHLITIPVHLEQRLEKKMKKEGTKIYQRMKIVQKSREGRKTQPLIICKRHELNHYLGGTYARNSEVPLASKSWHHIKSKGDWFTIRPATKASEFGFIEGQSTTFEDLGVTPDIVKRLNENNAFKPTYIQQLAIPKVLKGNNSLITAETGCGKTLAYLIPLVQQLLADKRRRRKRGVNQPLAVILVPSHELASQIYYVATKLTEGMGINIKLLERGNIGSKVANPASDDIDLMISTIHILSALKTVGLYSMTKVQHVILDEADTLLDDSFSSDVISFLHGFSFNPTDTKFAQLSLVSATLPKTVEMTLDGIVPSESLNRISTPNIHYVMSHVPQTFYRVGKSKKPEKLLELVQEDLKTGSPVMIFCNKTTTCNWMYAFLSKEHDIPCIRIHGDIPPSRRKGLMDKYQNGEINVLICTDLGSRGINTIRTRHVLNYEFPMFTADYIHRCGRTGRVGSTGACKVSNFISRRFEFQVTQEIEKSVRTETSMRKVDANIKKLINARYGMHQPIVGKDTDEPEEIDIQN